MNSQIGSLVSIDGKDHIHVPRSQIGFALFGPYVELEPGNYEVEFNFRLGSNVESGSNEVVCKLDVACALGTEILIRVDVAADQFGNKKDSTIAIPFSISEKTPHLEFRVWSLGKVDFAIAIERPVRLVSAAPTSRRMKGLFKAAGGFCDEHAIVLRNLSAQGASISRAPDSALVSLAGVNAVARHREDFQIISEVLVFNTYNITPLRDSIVIDVGMNIGLASVFFAKQRWARKVYGFEPFRDPFTRSKETFDSNSALREKIFPRNAGLSDKNERPFVHYSTDGTIATGIKGMASGPVQQLEILDAGDVFATICAEARTSGLGVVVKLDCEGSEFPIMKRLAECSLIGEIDAFMIEWHKVWSPDVSLKDLTEPLRANGFVLFDHTVEADLFAGMLYAVKAHSGSP